MPDWGGRSDPESLTRETEPYHFQRDRQLFNRQPRPAQANTNQPNQKNVRVGWGLSTQEYWESIFDDYLRQRREK